PSSKAPDARFVAVISIHFREYDPGEWGFFCNWQCRSCVAWGGMGLTVPTASRLRRAALATFRQNVEATIPALRRYARALTRDTDIADDLVQDTLVRALRSEHLFHGGDARSWLYTILTNLNRNRLRSLARRPALSPIEDNDAPDLAGPEAGG